MKLKKLPAVAIIAVCLSLFTERVGLCVIIAVCFSVFAERVGLCVVKVLNATISDRLLKLREWDCVF